MTEKQHRFSKARALAVLDARAARIAEQENFNRSWGTAQLRAANSTEAEILRLDRAVEYGRMRAFEEFACSIEENFRFDVEAIE